MLRDSPNSVALAFLRCRIFFGASDSVSFLLRVWLSGVPRAALSAMGFTGIVEEMGKVKKVQAEAKLKTWDGKEAAGFVLEIECKTALEDAYLT